MNTHAPVGLVSIRKCAALLAELGEPVSHVALAAYVARHGLVRREEGSSKLVDFAEVRDHRRANYTREVMRGIAASPAPAPLAAAGTSVVVPLDAAKRLKEAQATQAELELARDLGEITDVAEVDAGAAEAIVALRASQLAAIPDQAELLAAELGLPPERVRVLRVGLKRFARIGQTAFASRLATSLAAVNEDHSAAQARLMTLAAHALRLRKRSDQPLEARA